MSTPFRTPTFLAGTPRSSGDVQTGEVIWTQGGGRAASIYSGAVAPNLTAAPGSVATGPDVLFYSGGGRLKDVLLHTTQLSNSGVPIFFYDAGVTSSGGPFNSSGHKVIAVVNAPTGAGVSGSLTSAGMVSFDIPFQSGLCAATKSGQVGFTVTWIPESTGLDRGGVVGL